ncbi:ATP-dependent nuclease [Thermoanaerobacterium thermosaccharolyticum]|uniref:ATP-dependent nuclease n=1 Tax=Thermoanaerobacterium thermosaccharolyticum TaxID=1517 RepID=UPI00177CB2D3|nr:AAA family ATPase [Thermoanaerobacterium thermosaccharolyticum]MBE0069277.1 AAA family ATPase [Thermoanaerobacterium thermosaccharolyticum]MBE0229063.1 AAA family ATPase [Thermoanaerobacterium thermosaccharolyticum]
MYLKRLIIRNFRSIKHVDIKFEPGKNIIIGRNNCGKSNIIKAIDILLGESAPAWQKNENITEKDFYTFNDNNNDIVSDNIFIYGELKRDDREEINYDIIDDKIGYYKYNREISKDALLNEFEEEFNISVDELDHRIEKTYIRGISSLKNEFKNKYIFAYALKVYKSENGDIIKKIRFFYRENENSNWTMGFSAPIRNEFIQSAIIPSFRDPALQLRINEWSWYGKLLKYLTLNNSKREKLDEAYKQVQDIADEIFSDIKDEINDENLNVAFPNTKLIFQLNADVRTDIYKNTLIYVDDGFKSLITEKGAGIQSATIIGLFSYYTNYVNTRTTALLCVEEPELYLHPHACRVISYKLDKFIKQNKNQVIITTHSPEFLKTIKSNINVILVRKISGRSITNQLNLKEFKEILIDNNQNELFFADKVIICEGYDSYVIRWIAEEFFGDKLNEENISIISAGGKDRISKFVKLTLKLGIETYIMADFDYLLRDNDTVKTKSYGVDCHESIANISDSLFEQKFNKDYVKVISKISKIRNKIKSDYEERFYTAKNIKEFDDSIYYNKLKDFLKYLRHHVICILSGDIESIFNKGVLNLDKNNKLTMERIFEINSKIANDFKISDIVDVEEIKEFLENIFNNS